MNESTGSLPSPFEDGALYEVLFHDFSYGLEYYLGLAREAGPVLDVCCGTGRVMIPALQAGLDVEGVDLFEPMLDRLREKAAALGLNPRLYRADMREFRTDRKYGLVMIPFNAFVHNMTQEDQVACMTRCRERLLPGGLLAFDTFFPGLSIVGAPQNTRVLELEAAHPVTGQRFRVYDTRIFDRVDQTQRSVMDIEFLDADGGIERSHRSETRLRYIYREEMKLLLRVAGFARWEIYGSFERSPLAREDDAMIVEAWA